MASFWDMLGKAAGVMQLAGVDALGMVSMVVQAARTARRNRDLCQQLAKKVEIVSGLLEELNIPELRLHRKTRRPLDELRMALFRGYVLVWSCSQQQQNASQIWKMFMAADVAAMLRQAKDEIDSYIILIPLITTVASVKARESESNEAAAAQRRPQLSIQEVPHSPSSSSQEVSHSLELEEKQPSWSTSVCLRNYEPSQTSSQSSHASASNWEQEHLSELVLMMVHSADTARYNRDPCQQLARQALIVSNQLQGPLGAQRLRLEQLEDLLFRGYMLICFCSQYSRSQLQRVFTGADVASVFQLAQQEMGRQIYHLTSRVPAQQEEDEDGANNSAQDQCSPLSIYREPLSTATTSMSRQADSASGVPVITVDSVEFSYEELFNATNEFSMSNKIGQGGFGAVYYAELRGEKAAIKKMDMLASHEFLAELKVLTHVHHLNLVRLIGFCTKGSMFLVYEFIENGNLSQHLRGTGYEPLTWAARVQIALDSARGLEYIHEHTVPVYIHRDIKPANILIDKNYRAKVADFGLSRLTEVGSTSLPTRGIVGTFGYMPPEYARYGDVSPKVDVYAFGVVLYELISAKEAIVRSTESNFDSKGLVYLFEEALNTPDPKEGLLRLIDPALDEDYPIESILKMTMLARACTQEDPKARPTMRSIVVALMTLSSTSEFWDMNAAIQENQGLVNLMSGR